MNQNLLFIFKTGRKITIGNKYNLTHFIILIMKAILLTISLCFASFVVYGSDLMAQDTGFIASLKGLYSTVIRDKNSGWYMVENDDKWGYVDNEGDLAVALQYEVATSFREGMAAVQRDGLWGFVNLQGEEVVPPIYSNAGIFQNGMAIVEYKGKWGWIDRFGTIAIAISYDFVMPFHNDGRAAARRGNKWGWIDRAGKTVIAFDFDKIDSYEEGLVRVTKGENTFYIDKFGRCVEDCYHENNNIENTAATK